MLKIELDQHRNHIQLLYNYLPSTFCTASGENETISMVLLLDRVMHKVALVIDYVNEIFIFSIPIANICLGYSPEAVFSHAQRSGRSIRVDKRLSQIGVYSDYLEDDP